MDKRIATLTLTEKLKALGYNNKIKDPVIKNYLLNNAKSVVFDFEEGKLEERSRQPKANYFFTRTQNSSSGLYVALIGGMEERILRKEFYKDVPNEVVKAFEILEIPHFIREYKTYSFISEENHFFPLLNYVPFEKGMKVEARDIIQGYNSQKYYLVQHVNQDGGIAGYVYYDVELKNPFKSDDNSVRYGVCEFQHVQPVKKNVYSEAFFDFVFDLPYEEQNLVANKMILKNVRSVNFLEIFLKEYLTGEYFKDYFLVLDKDTQKEVVDKIQVSSHQNKLLNSWLFSQGFPLELDYLELYKTDSKKFIEYFEKSSPKTRELIISDIFDCEHTNQEVGKFLEREYSHLLRDTVFKE
ncbi:MAG: hypothetical protein ISS23_01295 [Nanoarchaeota archaeon]|nr:hypothetical protein [Nanoarchaeota archaeon]